MALKKKLSIDFWQENYDKLDTYIDSLEMVMPNTTINKGYVINYLIDSVIGIDDTVRQEMYAFCYTQMKDRYSQAENSDGFDKAEKNRIAQQYEKLVNLFNNFKSYQNPPKQHIPMQRINMKDSYIICPKNWIIVNEDQAKYSNYAYAVEIRDRLCQYNAPHFLLFGEYPVRKLSESMTNELYRQCAAVYPKFGEWMKMQIEPVFGERNEMGIRPLLNEEEYTNAPLIGIFEIPLYGDLNVGEYPFGAMVVPAGKSHT